MTRRAQSDPAPSRDRWLLLFYTVPSRPAGLRIKLWRKLARSGAVPLKSAVYILPATEEHAEFFHWLITEVTAKGGDGMFVRVPSVETMKDQEIVALFNAARERVYAELAKTVEILERKVQSARKGTATQHEKKLAGQHAKLARLYRDIRSVDFFKTKAGKALAIRLSSLEAEIRDLPGASRIASPAGIERKNPAEYRGKTWTTRKHPFVDRMASAWLIRRFLDGNARFDFLDVEEISHPGGDAVTFDIRGGEFTHRGDLCTFEVLVQSFGIKDHGVRKIAGIVHDLDMKDEKYKTGEAKGVEEILRGIRKTAATDHEALEKGIVVFDLLYASLS